MDLQQHINQNFTSRKVLEEIKKLGLTLDQYLASTGRNTQDFRAEYTRKAENDLKLEFALQKVAETEKIVVSDDDISKSIAGAKTDAERRERYFKTDKGKTTLRQMLKDYLNHLR